MLSDMVWRESFHIHIAVMPVTNAAHTQSMAMTGVIERSCMFQV